MLSLALDPPDLSGVVNAIDNLRDAGALTLTSGDIMKVLDDCDEDPSGEITHLGRLYARLPLNFRVSRMLFLAHIFGYLEEGLIMAACMSVRSPFRIRLNPSLDSFIQRLEFADGTNSDSLSSMFLYREWKYEKDLNHWNYRQRRTWESKHYVNGKTLCEIEDLVRQLAKRLNEHGIKVPEGILAEIDVDEEQEDQAVELDRGRSRYRSDDYDRSPSRSLSPVQTPVKRDDRLMLKAILFGSFYPNYLQTSFVDERSWSYACNNFEKLPYDPTRTVEINQ
mgnify:CR=1 FL=1